MCNLSEALIDETREETREESIEFLVVDNLEEGKSRDQIIKKLMRGYKLDEDKAASYFEKYKNSVLA